MANEPRPESDLQRELQHAIECLQVSADAYDRGFKGEAARLAALTHMILVDSRSQHSLLTQLGLAGVRMRNSCVTMNPNNLVSETPLVLMQVGADPEDFYIPILDGGPFGWMEPVSPEVWLAQNVLMDQSKRMMSRASLVANMRDRDGGSHVDPKLDSLYADWKLRNAAGWDYTFKGNRVEIEYGPTYASMRQLAFELTETLRDLFPEKFR